MGSEQGLLPSTAEELLKIRGIGKYTAGAIASIAFGQVFTKFYIDCFVEAWFYDVALN